MRLSVNQKMVETGIFLGVTTPLAILFCWARRMPASDIALDRLSNVLTTVFAALIQDSLRRKTNSLVGNRLERTDMAGQILRPIVGIGQLFAGQLVLYLPPMLLGGADPASVTLGVTLQAGGSCAWWIWQEKFRFIVLVWERGRNRVAKRIDDLQRFVSGQLGKLARRG